MTFLAQEMSAIVWWLTHSLVLPFLGTGMKIGIFQSCGHCWVIQIFWHNECKTLMASSFRDLNSSAGISSYPRALLTAVLLKAHLTLHSRMSGSRWVMTPSWLSGSWRSFLHSFRYTYVPFWRRQWHPTPVLLPGKSHGPRSLVGCSPWGRYESDTTEWLQFHSSLSCIGEGNGNPLQCSCLENPRDGGAWWAAFYGVIQSRTQLKRLSRYEGWVGESAKVT